MSDPTAGMFYGVSSVSTIQARLDFLQSQMHALNLAIDQAHARGDQDAIDRMRVTYRKLALEVSQLQEDARVAEMPSAFMLALSDFSDEAIIVGKKVGDVTLQTAQGVASLVKALPWVIAVALIVVGLVYAGKIRHGLK